MTVKINFVSFTFIFFMITITSEASISTSPKSSPYISPAMSPSPLSSPTTTCEFEKIAQQMGGITEETREFITKYLLSRIDNKDKMDEKNKECLNKIYHSYQGALGIVEYAINDLSLRRYSNVIKSLKGYQSTIASTLDCPEDTDLISVNPEFKGMKEWAYYSTEVVISGIKSCRPDLLEL